MKKISLNKIIFFLISFGFISLNIIIANISQGFLPLILLAIRDSWVLLFFILLIYKREYELTFFLVSSFVLGLVPVIYSKFDFNFLTFFYGFRDLSLIAFIMFFLKTPFQIKKKTYNILLIIIFGFALLQLISQYFDTFYFLENFFKTQEYYSNKGITSNTSGGFFGQRLTIPLYSSSLLGTFCAFYFFKSNYKGKLLSLITGVFTLSKSIILIPLFYFFKSFYKTFILIFFVALISLRTFIDFYISNNEASIITFHLGSIRDRFNSIDMLIEKFPNLVPEILGNNSIAAKSFLGLDPSTAPESLIIARLLDFNILIIVPMFFIALFVLKNFNTEKKFLFSVVLILSFFSNLSNHPIAFVPIISTSILIKNNLINNSINE